VIVTLGAEGAEAVFGQRLTGGVQANRGRVIWSEEFGCPVVVTYHPSYALRRPQERFWIVMDLVKAKTLLDQGCLPEPALVSYNVVDSLETAFWVRDQILRCTDKVAFDWETTGIHLTKSWGFLIAFSFKERESWVFPRYQQFLRPYWKEGQLEILDREVLIPILTSDVPKIGFHVAYDNCITMNTLGVWPSPIKSCVMIKSHLLFNHRGQGAHGLKVLCDTYTDMGRYDDALENYRAEHKIPPDELYKVPNDMLWWYNGADADGTLRVDNVLDHKVDDSGLREMFDQERVPLVLTYQEMDRTGIRIDVDYLRRISGELEESMFKLLDKIEKVAGKPLNPSSPQQVQKYLFEERGLPVFGRTDIGQPSTKEEFLKLIEEMEPTVPLILQYRAYSKIKGTYVDGRKGGGGLAAVVDEDGRARMNTLLHGTETFRLSTRKPFPIMTWPRNVEGMPSVRALVLPDEGCSFIEADYSQEEFLIEAIAAEQWDLVDAMLVDRMDIHEIVMNWMMGVAKSQFADLVGGKWVFHSHEAETNYKNIRSKGKQVNFSVLYRGGYKQLARQLWCSEEEAAHLIQDYYDRFPGIKHHQYRVIKQLRETGRVVGLFGTYRELPGVFDDYKWAQYEAERQACNFIPQNAGAHILARALIRVDRRFRESKIPGARVVFTLHDQLVAQARRDCVEEARGIVVEEMRRPIPQLEDRAPHVDVEITEQWGG